jgi:hypothetical protein
MCNKAMLDNNISSLGYVYWQFIMSLTSLRILHRISWCICTTVHVIHGLKIPVQTPRACSVQSLHNHVVRSMLLGSFSMVLELLSSHWTSSTLQAASVWLTSQYQVNCGMWSQRSHWSGSGTVVTPNQSWGLVPGIHFLHETGLGLS